MESTGAKTLMHSAISSVVVLIVIVAIGFIFQTLPIVIIQFFLFNFYLNFIFVIILKKACLSSIIVIALIPMLIEVKQIVTIFKRSKVEAVIR